MYVFPPSNRATRRWTSHPRYCRWPCPNSWICRSDKQVHAFTDVPASGLETQHPPVPFSRLKEMQHVDCVISSAYHLWPSNKWSSTVVAQLACSLLVIYMPSLYTLACFYMARWRAHTEAFLQHHSLLSLALIQLCSALYCCKTDRLDVWGQEEPMLLRCTSSSLWSACNSCSARFEFEKAGWPFLS